MSHLPDTVEGRCSVCGDPDLMLCDDMIRYTPCTFVAGEWVEETPNTEPSEGDDSVRFWCTGCGQRHALPEALL